MYLCTYIHTYIYKDTNMLHLTYFQNSRYVCVCEVCKVHAQAFLKCVCIDTHCATPKVQHNMTQTCSVKHRRRTHIFEETMPDLHVCMHISMYKIRADKF